MLPLCSNLLTSMMYEVLPGRLCEAQRLLLNEPCIPHLLAKDLMHSLVVAGCSCL